MRVCFVCVCFLCLYVLYVLCVYLCCLCYLCYVYFLLLPSLPSPPYISSYLYILKTPVRVGVPDVYILERFAACVVCVGVAAFVCDGACVARRLGAVCVCRGG